jgi:hypothetical protein
MIFIIDLSKKLKKSLIYMSRGHIEYDRNCYDIFDRNIDGYAGYNRADNQQKIGYEMYGLKKIRLEQPENLLAKTILSPIELKK